MKIYDPRKPIPYIPVADRAQADPTTFMIRSLFAPEHDEVVGLAMPKDADEIKVNRRVLELGLVSWKKLFNQDNEVIEPVYDDGGKLLPESIDLLPPGLRIELIKEIMRISTLTSDDQKNLQPPASSLPA